ncbi:DNA adenine methylase [Treponema sp. OttesenSCG-928-L16]|nr:DNA adenine methylase [Treponema sp. OttesenSCG-928-L16]
MACSPAENEAYLSRQLITYIGNKRSLLAFIGEALSLVKKKIGREKLDLFDVFSGSGIIARYFKGHARRLIANDIEGYSEVINSCYLANPSEIDMPLLRDRYESLIRRLEHEALRPNFIAELYAPRDDRHILKGERVFYTARNAAYIDTARQYIEEIAEPYRKFFLAPLLSESSVHANTAGVFKGFYKDRKSGIGSFGGSAGDALGRIKGNIELPFPVFSNFECPAEVFREDANRLVRSLDEVDLAYLDPPYNQHPYGSNYFMLNLICEYKRPELVSPVSGIPPDWQRSDYNKRKEAAGALKDLAENIRAKYLLVSFNSEGFIPHDEMTGILKKIGRLTVLEKDYTVFRGSRNLRNRSIHNKEYLYLVEK